DRWPSPPDCSPVPEASDTRPLGPHTSFHPAIFSGSRIPPDNTPNGRRGRRRTSAPTGRPLSTPPRRTPSAPFGFPKRTCPRPNPASFAGHHPGPFPPPPPPGFTIHTRSARSEPARPTPPGSGPTAGPHPPRIVLSPVF